MHVLLAAGECKEELAASSITMLCVLCVLCKYDTAASVFWPRLLFTPRRAGLGGKCLKIGGAGGGSFSHGFTQHSTVEG